MDDVIEGSPNHKVNIVHKRQIRSQKYIRIQKKEIKKHSASTSDELSALGCSLIPDEENESITTISDDEESDMDIITETPDCSIMIAKDNEAKLNESVISNNLEIQPCTSDKSKSSGFTASDRIAINENKLEVEVKTPQIKMKPPSSKKKFAHDIFPLNIFETQDQASEQDEDEDDSLNLSQMISSINVKVSDEPVKQYDFYENIRFIQNGINAEKNSKKTDELPLHLIKTLEEHSEKKEESVIAHESSIELFCDEIYGGLGPTTEKLRNPSPKFSRWTILSKENRLKRFCKRQEFKNIYGKMFPTMYNNVLSQYPPFQNDGSDKIEFKGEHLPMHVQKIVEDFEDQDDLDESLNCSPIQLTLIKPQMVYKNTKVRKNFEFNEEMDYSDQSESDNDDGTPFFYDANSNIPTELDFSRDSNILMELSGLTQKLMENSQNFNQSLTSPNRSLLKLPDDFGLKSSPGSQYSTPKSQKSIELPNFGSQEKWNDDYFVNTRTIATSPIKFECIVESRTIATSPITFECYISKSSETKEVKQEPSITKFTSIGFGQSSDERKIGQTTKPDKFVEEFSKTHVFAPNFSGFGLASGKSVLQNTKSVNIFNEILEEFPLDTVSSEIATDCKSFGSVSQKLIDETSKSKNIFAGEPIQKCDSAPNFTGFDLANGKPIFQNTKGVNLFNEILDEYPIGTSTSKCFGLSSAKNIVNEISKTTNVLNDIADDFPNKVSSVVGESNSKSSFSKPLPRELEDNSFDNQISEVFLSPLKPIDKNPQDNLKISPLNSKENVQPLSKRVNQLRSPQVNKSLFIESPESFMSDLINRQSIAASTPLMNKRGNLKTVKRTKLLNRLTEEPEEQEQSSMLEEMSVDMKELRKISYSEQAIAIETKSETMKAAMPGALFVRKQQENKLKWKNFVQEIRNFQPTIEIVAKDIIFNNAKHFRFNLLQMCSKSELESNKMYFSLAPTIKIIPDERFRIGFGEFFNTFMTLPGVNKTLISPKWFQHHYRMVVFKLVQYAKRAKVAPGVFLTPQNIIEQIKFRYDLEIDKVARSAIKRCIEGDDIPGKRLVLEVVDIQENVVTLSDGWYAIKAESDFELKNKIKEGKLIIGRKIITSGAEIKNLDTFCDPINMPDNVRLKIHYNSTRIAPVDSKLGYQRNPFPLLIHLNDIKVQGSLVSSVLAYVARVYPPIFQNKLTKEYYNEYQERRLCIKWEEDRCAKANRILEETTKEVKNDLKLTSFNASPGTKEVHQLRCAIEEESDTININPAQRILLDSENERINNEIARRVLNKSRTLAWQVSPCLRICILDVHQPKTGVILTIWDPKDVYNPNIKENQVFKITNLNPSVCDGALRLFSTNNTKFEQVHASFADTERFNRKITQIEDISRLKINPPEFDEVDIICYVVFVQRRDQVHLVYVTNAKADMVIINFCSSLEESGYSEIVKEGAFLSFQNLQWRSVGSNTNVFPTLFVKNLFTKISLLSERKVSAEQKTFIESFKAIDCNRFVQELSITLGIDLSAVKINESLGDTSRPETVGMSVTQSNDNSLGTTSKRKRLGNTNHTSKKKMCTRSQTNIR